MKKRIELTKAMQQEYLKTQGHYCPFCQSDEIAQERTKASQREGPGVLMRMIHCFHCKASWMDVYHLATAADLGIEEGYYVPLTDLERELTEALQGALVYLEEGHGASDLYKNALTLLANVHDREKE